MASKLSRRQLLTVAGLTVGTAWVELGGSPSAAYAAPAGDLVLEPVPDHPVRVLSPDGGAPSAVPRQLAVRVRNDDVVLPTGTALKVTFEGRLYAVLPAPLLTLGGRRLAATATTAPDPATGLTVCTVTLGEQVPARTADTGDLIAVVGTVNPYTFPYDMVRKPADPIAAVGETTRVPGARRNLKSSRPSSFGTAVTPWGVEVAGGWTRLTWGPDGRYWYWYPTLVSVRGTGPGRTPAAAFAVTVDPQIVTDVTVTGARLNGEPYAVSKITVSEETVTGSLRRLRWTAKARLDAGDQLDAELTVVTRTPAGALETITHPVVSTSMAAHPGARQTGLMSVSRADSSWE
ncbi:hypothetical protein [Actinoplanes rectilineatus]|uniref:hypothetical protein n=1 Tax=Actinoplanes rectilineatus TaxID=113571 RepID=UPI0005F2886E|nr:hypothetical protein [Actinoplanes rectilineatus]